MDNKYNQYNYNEEYYSAINSTEYITKDKQTQALAKYFTDKYHPASVVDLGCGRGQLVANLRRIGIEAYGLDISEYALAAAVKEVRSFLKRIDIEKTELPFDDSSIEMITALEFFEHIRNMDNVIKEIKRILKPHGYLYMTSPLPITNFRLVQLLNGRGWKILDITHVNIHWPLYWRRYFNRNGFKYLGRESKCYKEVKSDYRIVNTINYLPGGWFIRTLLNGSALFIIGKDNSSMVKE